MNIDFPLYLKQDMFSSQKDLLFFLPQAGWAKEMPHHPELLVWDLASLTKFYGTTLLSLLLHQRKKLSLEKEVGFYFPGFKQKGLREIRLHHLLKHQSGLPAWLPPYAMDPHKKQQIDSLILTAYPKVRLSHKRIYSDLNFQLLGLILEMQAESRLSDLIQEHLAAPLGLTTFGYTPLKRGLSASTIVPSSIGQQHEKAILAENRFQLPEHVEQTCFPGERAELIRGEVHDHNCHAYFHGVAGHAGIFSNLKDLERLNACLFQKEEKSFFEQNSLDLFFGDFKTSLLGAARIEKDYELPTFSASSIGHFGFTGTFVALDLQSKTSCVLLSSRLLSKTSAPTTKELVENLLT